MLAWVQDVTAATLDNPHFRAVLETGTHLQLTVMRLAPREEIGWEVHDHNDQYLRVERGTGRVDLGRGGEAVDESHALRAGWAVIIPAGLWHNVVNTGDNDLQLLSVYAPPEHPDGTVHRTKAEAEAAEHH